VTEYKKNIWICNNIAHEIEEVISSIELALMQNAQLITFYKTGVYLMAAI